MTDHHSAGGRCVHLLLSGPLFALWLTLGVAPAAAIEWNEPERITHNTIEDRTGSGSLVYPCFGEAYAIWMQEQPGLGWRLMAAERNIHGWSEPAAIDPGDHPDFDPRLALGNAPRAVWQRGTSSGAEIMFAERQFGGGWAVEPVTANTSEDLSPDLPAYASAGEPRHVVWVGFDPQSQSGKIFHAVDSGTGWETERLDGSELGPFWTGAEPRIDVSSAGVVHVVYRGGDYGNYHLHHARKQGGIWSYQVLFSGNGNDFSVDVSARIGPVVVAMSGNDGFGFPSHIYVRRSTDGGITFGPPELVSGSYSAELGNLAVGAYGLAIVGPEVSGNIYTGNLLYWLDDGLPPELLPPLNMASEWPSAGLIGCIPNRTSAGDQAVLYENHQGAGADSAEVYFLATPGPPEGIHDEPAPSAATRLAVGIVPNPFSASTRILVENLNPLAPAAPTVAVYDPAGRLVRRLTSASSTAGGSQILVWDGKTEEGVGAAAGVYVVRIEADEGSANRRVVRVK